MLSLRNALRRLLRNAEVGVGAHSVQTSPSPEAGLATLATEDRQAALEQELAIQRQRCNELAAELTALKRETSLAVLEREQANEALRRSEAQLKGIIGSATDAIITIDEAQRITLFNRGAETVFRCSAAEAIGQPLERFVPHRSRGVHSQYIAAFGETGVSTRAMGQQREFLALRADETEFPMEAQISQVTVGGEKLFTVILRDISERKQAEVERERLLRSERAARAVAEAANRAKDAFLATISHELRTPLSPILCWSRMLREGALDGSQSCQALEAIERNARAQARLIEDLLDVSRIVSGKLRLDVCPVEVQPVIQAAIEVVRPAADAKNIRLQAVLDTASATVSGDPQRLQQVVWNLLSNAIKFTPKGGRVQVVLERVNSHVEIAVVDNGPGISPEFLPRVFERFQQADNTDTREHGGLGLGLAIVRHIVELHGGNVRVESPGPGRGAVFTVTLPLAAVTRALPPAERRHPTAVDTPPRRPYPELNGLRVLVVDDEPDSNETLRTLLTRCHAEVQTAASSAQALEISGNWRPDVLLSDIGMPDEDGYTLLNKLRARGGDFGRIPAIALTAYASPDDRVRALEAGFQMHVPKPVEPIELVTVVANVARTAGKLVHVTAPS